MKLPTTNHSRPAPRVVSGMSRPNGADSTIEPHSARDVPMARPMVRASAAPAIEPTPATVSNSPTTPEDTCTVRTRNNTTTASYPMKKKLPTAGAMVSVRR